MFRGWRWSWCQEACPHSLQEWARDAHSSYSASHTSVPAHSRLCSWTGVRVRSTHATGRLCHYKCMVQCVWYFTIVSGRVVKLVPSSLVPKPSHIFCFTQKRWEGLGTSLGPKMFLVTCTRFHCTWFCTCFPIESYVWRDQYKPGNWTDVTNVWWSRFTVSVTTQCVNPSHSSHTPHTFTTDTIHW